MPQNAQGVASKAAPALSSRGQQTLVHAGPFISFANNLFQNAYHPVTNPDGFCNLGVAENSLQHAELVAHYKSKFDICDVDFTYGTDLSGSVRLSKALAGLFNTHFAPVSPVMPEHLVAGAGCSAILDQLAFHIANPGDGILIPVPYYTGFNHDLSARSGVKPVPVLVDQADPFGVRTLEVFEDTLAKAEAEGTTIRGVMLCNPHNPLGQCYPRETILAYARFCEKHNLHLISDEIYAFSVFPTDDVPQPTPFVSAFSIDFVKEAGCDPARVHVVYGMSKDFNANGLRGGVLVSQHNPALVTTLKSTSIFMKMSSAAAALWSAVLEDDAYLRGYMAENQRRLSEAYEFITRWFRAQGIPYLPSNAGHFLMADLRQFFPTHDFDNKLLPALDEDNGAACDGQMFKLLIANKLYLGSATAFSYPTPGWCRITFATRRDYLVVGLERLERALGMTYWEGLDGAGAGSAGRSLNGQPAKTTGAKEVERVSEQLEKTAL